MASLYGANPANIQWTVVRGDTAKLRIEFLSGDGTTPSDSSSWTYASSAYNPKTNAVDALNVVAGQGYVDIIANSATTATWGTGYAKTVAELSFDLQVSMPDDVVWTPIIGSIIVIPDITQNNP